jgi:hypothetical protein
MHTSRTYQGACGCLQVVGGRAVLLRSSTQATARVAVRGAGQQLLLPVLPREGWHQGLWGVWRHGPAPPVVGAVLRVL